MMDDMQSNKAKERAVRRTGINDKEMKGDIGPEFTRHIYWAIGEK